MMRTIYAAAVLVLAGLASCTAAADKPVGAEAARPRAETVSAGEAETAGRQPSKRVRAQQEAMKALAFLDGEWRGASKSLRKGEWAPMLQTESVGTMLDGTVKLIETRGYEPDGALSFDALRIIAYDPERKAYAMRSYQGGRVRDHALERTADGFAWEIEAGKEMTIRYEMVVRNGLWTERATRIPANGDPEPYLEFTVKRVGESAWAEAGAVGLR